MKHKAYMLVYKPSKCKCWTLVHGNEHKYIRDYYKYRSLVFVKRADARNAVSLFNEWNMQSYLKGLKVWDVLLFKVATLQW